MKTFGPAVVCVLWLWGVCGFAQAADSVLTGFDAKDFHGHDHKLSDYADRPILVVAFLGVECPLAKLYSLRLEQLHKEFSGKGVTILGVDSNRQDSPTEIAQFVRRQGLGFPMLVDPGCRLADALGATRTPEVFVLDQNRIVRYRGRIDDQYQVGVVRDKPQKQELRNAITALMENRPVEVVQTQATGCLIGRPKVPVENSEVTWSRQVSRIVQKRCQECHREGDIGPFALMDYSEAAGWGDMIAEVVREGRMPPWNANPEYGHFSNARSLPEEEKQILLTWVKNGCPQGDPSELPEPLVFTSGWQMTREPEQIFKMADKPFAVPADAGPRGVAYQNFVFDPGFTEDKWVAQAEVLPGNRAVVHHIIVYVHPDPDHPQREEFLVAYVPGLRSRAPKPGYAKRIPAGSKLRFQVHYTPNGMPQEDLSQVGFIYAKSDEVTHEVITAEALNAGFTLEPGLDNQRVDAQSRSAPMDLQLLTMSPHMHLRGKAFRYELETPDGQRKILLDVPQYDFNWQTSYELAEPLTIPKGGRLVCTALFDNSANNPNNPDPTATVRWGDQSWDEMMIGYFDIVIPRREETRSKVIGPDIPPNSNFGKLDTDKNGVITREEAKAYPLLFQFYDSVDADGSGDLDIIELSRAMRRLQREREKANK